MSQEGLSPEDVRDRGELHNIFAIGAERIKGGCKFLTN
jgi:hypothetical protein